MGGDGEPEDPDRLVIADENGAENRLKQEMTGSGYDSRQGGGQYPTQGVFPANGTDPKVKGEKKERKKHNRFNGMSDEEVAKKILPDLIAPDLDILIVSIKVFCRIKNRKFDAMSSFTISLIIIVSIALNMSIFLSLQIE